MDRSALKMDIHGEISKLKQVENTDVSDVTVGQITTWAAARIQLLYERIKVSPMSGRGRQFDIDELRTIAMALEHLNQVAMAAKLDCSAILEGRERHRAVAIERFSSYQSENGLG